MGFLLSFHLICIRLPAYNNEQAFAYVFESFALHELPFNPLCEFSG